MVWFVGESYGLVGARHFVTNGGNFLPAELPGIATLLDQVTKLAEETIYTAEKTVAAQKVKANPTTRLLLSAQQF